MLRDKRSATSHVWAALRDLEHLFDHAGPWLTLWAATPAAVDNPAKRAKAQWHHARHQAKQAGAPTEALDAVEPIYLEAYRHGDGLVVLADTSGVRHVEHLPEAPRAELARWAELPSLAPIVEHRQALVPHVVVLVDRIGADIITAAADDLKTSEVEGVEYPISKNAPGGWSQPRYQQRAENTWEHNAKAVADEVLAAVNASGARLVVVAGDVRAVQLLLEELPDRVRELVQVVPGGRAVDGSAPATAAEIDVLVRTAVASETVAILRRFDEEAGQHDRAAVGPEATLASLSAAQVDVLLAHDDPDDDRTAWFDAGGPTAALDHKVLDDLGIDDVRQGRLIDVALRSALLTGASIRIVPAATLPDGRLGALLRWA